MNFNPQSAIRDTQSRPPRIVIAPNSFKESASAIAVARAMAEGVARALPQADILQIPLADGGEGTAGILAAATGGRMVSLRVSGPLGEAVQARYAILGDGKTAVIEMAEAAGLNLVPAPRRDPRVTTTRGVGELIAAALDGGLRRIIIGLGGSATNDAGAGMAQALGYSLKDAAGNELPAGGAALARLASISGTGVSPVIRSTGETPVPQIGCEILAACDVTNPLCGPNGAAQVYGPQKGATPAAADELDAALQHFAQVYENQFGVSLLNLPGGGAAGGLGAGLVAFAGGRLRPGFELVAEACRLEERLAGAGLILTGEGRLDAQTLNGKVPAGVARLGRRLGIPVVALAGCLGPGYEDLYNEGLTAAFSICPGPLALAEAMARTEELTAAASAAVARLWAGQ